MPRTAHAEAAVQSFAALFGAKYPKAVAKVVADAEQLLAVYDFPAEHWVHLKTSNPIESTFATVRLRTRVTKGPGSRAAGLAMVFKLIRPRRSTGATSTARTWSPSSGPERPSRRECWWSGPNRPPRRTPRDQSSRVVQALDDCSTCTGAKLLCLARGQAPPGDLVQSLSHQGRCGRYHNVSAGQGHSAVSARVVA